MRGLFFTTDLMFSSRVTSTAQALGRQVEVAGSAAALLQKLADGDVRLVILDLNSPGLDAAALIPQLRQAEQETGAHAAIIAYDSHVRDAKLGAAREAGCDEVMSRGQFSNSIEQLLTRHLTD